MPESHSLPDPRLLSIGMQIRRLREEQGYSLEELAERSGLSFRGLIYIEHGQRNPSVLTLLRIASGLNVLPGKLLEGLSAQMLDDLVSDG
ncbi:helix-turn-helix domain-containing protein [Streptomyces sp. NBC_01288]|uniref:helix-turn-helix domain-containing protein n=1 Tax=unclassified Streptomyces TaxID=2593676 RepID=UPI002250EB33|nr:MULTISPECIES: helix-turn-helix transcriptional regulator [unclassified Streptomyces]MCX4810662.1 helix-turn-helix domain-containing protein [Streptomyces sp. NBC_01239]MCX5283004.1 helix-turn-helix domain-containing protein [Streptomyces sp. NBC_00198]WSL10653.1 helix-turn-helix domain-containing protein [Streptomyces sp. NBC_01288]